MSQDSSQQNADDQTATAPDENLEGSTDSTTETDVPEAAQGAALRADAGIVDATAEAMDDNQQE
jgi:hypothetical protein